MGRSAEGTGAAAAPAAAGAESDRAGDGPRAEYTRRLAARERTVARAAALERRIANLRLALFVGAGLALWLARGRLSAPVLLAGFGAPFAALVIFHGRLKARLARARRGEAFYRDALDRLDDRFAGRGVPGEEWADPEHPYATHLDVFGEGSLYELLCGARTAGGRETLAHWLLEPAAATEIAARQVAVRELAGHLDLREDLGTFEERVLAAFASRELVAWATGPPILASRPLRVAALGLSVATAAAAVAAAWIGTPPLAWLLLFELALWWRLRHRVAAILEGVGPPADALRLVRSALARIERERFEAPLLRGIGPRPGPDTKPASERLGDLLRRVDALEWRRNQMFLPIAALLLWGTNWAFAIERWRREHGDEVAGWIRHVAELEALLDLGRLAYERPEYVFPSIDRGPARLEARALRHPMLPECTPNDVALASEPALLVVTGSNMSGKSTLLRTVGVNAVLAQAGAPVRARSLDMSELAVGASIRTVDSLQDGASRFYAEIRAIRRALDVASDSPPGLFLLDELLHGTNSHDRRLGAGAIVRAFLERGALGILTTHDLALAEIADGLGARAANAHFEFALEESEIRFDYRLHPGVVRSGNALEIMRSAGLDV